MPVGCSPNRTEGTAAMTPPVLALALLTALGALLAAVDVARLDVAFEWLLPDAPAPAVFDHEQAGVL